MANFESLKTTVNESKATLVSAAKTIRALIIQRNDALSAATPEVVVKAAEETKAAVTSVALQADLEQARLDTEAAISEAGAPPVITPKPAAPAPVPATK